MEVYIKTFGCSMNLADSEIMAGLLQKEGYNIVNEESKAQLVIVNSCSVKGNAETKLYKQLRKTKKPVIVAGCVPQAEPNLVKTKLKGYSILGTSQLSNIVHVANETLNGNKVVMLNKGDNKRLEIPKVRTNPIVEITPISSGCLSNCTYCKTKFARGKIASYRIGTIVRHIENSIKEGCKEFWITSQDNGCYGYDIGSNLAELMKDIVNLEGNFIVRIGMMNPQYIHDYIDELIEVYKNDKVFKFLHIPVQSGSNKVLKDMKRDYDVETFKVIIKRFRKVFPDITISTDIICGFPTETREDFEESIKLVKEVKPNVLNISRFWSRPGTVAARMKLLPGEETKKRSTELKKVFDEVVFNENQKWVGWKGKVLVDEKGKNDTMIGRNFAYKQVILNGSVNIGDKIDVVIHTATKYDLRAN